MINSKKEKENINNFKKVKEKNKEKPPLEK